MFLLLTKARDNMRVDGCTYRQIAWEIIPTMSLALHPCMGTEIILHLAWLRWGLYVNLVITEEES